MLRSHVAICGLAALAVWSVGCDIYQAINPDGIDTPAILRMVLPVSVVDVSVFDN